MKKNIKLMILGFLLLATSFGVVYATVTVASSRKSANLPWQGTPNGHYDSAHNVGTSNVAESRFSFISGSTAGGTSVVKDSVTGLIWESGGSNLDTASNPWWQGAQTMKWSSAEDATNNAHNRCATLTKGYPQGTWRLPTIKELASIVDYTRNNPTVNTAYFSLATSDYWSSTTFAYRTSYVWSLRFYNGDDGYGYKSYDGYVLCVR